MNLNWPHIHLLINHFPVIGSILILLILSHGMWKKNHEIVRLSLLLWIFIGLMSIAVYFSGDNAADAIRTLPGVQKSFIEHHDDSATFTMIAIEATAGLSLLGLWFYREKSEYPKGYISTILILTIISIGFVAWTANLGGQIRHPEIRPGFQFPQPAPAQLSGPSQK
jgi:hypothetical protein